MPSTECAGCHAEVQWAEKFPVELNDQGRLKMAPVNVGSEGDQAGRLEVWQVAVATDDPHNDLYVLRFRYLRQGERPASGHYRGVSHFNTCPETGQWRSRKATQGGSG